MVLCRLTSMYKPSGPKTEVRAEIRIRAQKTAGIRVWILLPSMEAFGSS